MPSGNPYLGVAGGVAGLAQQYQQSYDSALSLNSQNYGNVLSGYNQVLGNLQQGQTAVGQGYGSLMSGIQNTLGANEGVPGVGNNWGIAAPAASAIQKLYSAQSGQQFDAQGNPTGTPTGGSIGQGLINSGLGNTTAAPNAQAQATSQYGTAIGGLGAQLAQTYAGYQSNIGQAYLQQQNQENLSLANQGNQQLNWMNSVQAPYPSGAAYNQLYQQYGQQQATAQQFGLQQQAQQQLLKSAGGRPQGGSISTPQMPGMPGSTYYPSGSGLTPNGFGLPSNQFGGGGASATGNNAAGYGSIYDAPMYGGPSSDYAYQPGAPTGYEGGLDSSSYSGGGDF